jgi:hypothetical protein
MKIHRLLSWLIVLSLSLVFGVSAEELSPDADEVARRVYDRDVGRDMHLLGTMELISAGGQKREREYTTLRLDTAEERKVKIRFTAPADIEGTGFLVVENLDSAETEQHLYLPALKRTRRIVASQQGRSFVNSDFTYEDMRRQPLKNWTYQLDADTAYLGRPCYVLVSEPKPTTDTQYTRIVSQVDKETFIALQIDFYDQKKRHCKTYRVENVAMVDGIATEMAVRMEDLLSNHVTRLLTRQVRYNNDLSAVLFTTRALEQ